MHSTNLTLHFSRYPALFISFYQFSIIFHICLEIFIKTKVMLELLCSNPCNRNLLGSGFAGLAAAVLAKAGKRCMFMKKWNAGGRACVFNAAGFTFDMGPSWYWMPEVFKDFTNTWPYYADFMRSHPGLTLPIRWCWPGRWGWPPSRLRPIAHPLWKHRKGQCLQIG